MKIFNIIDKMVQLTKTSSLDIGMSLKNIKIEFEHKGVC